MEKKISKSRQNEDRDGRLRVPRSSYCDRECAVAKWRPACGRNHNVGTGRTQSLARINLGHEPEVREVFRADTSFSFILARIVCFVSVNLICFDVSTLRPPPVLLQCIRHVSGMSHRQSCISRRLVKPHLFYRCLINLIAAALSTGELPANDFFLVFFIFLILQQLLQIIQCTTACEMGSWGRRLNAQNVWKFGHRKRYRTMWTAIYFWQNRFHTSTTRHLFAPYACVEQFSPS